MRGGKIETGQHVEEVVKRFEIPLLQYAERITGDREQARDVVQETFIKFQRMARCVQMINQQPGYLRFVEMERSTFVERRGESCISTRNYQARDSEQPMPLTNWKKKEATGFLLRIVALPARQQKCFNSNSKRP